MPAAGGNSVSLSFSSVTQAGQTTVTDILSSGTCPATPLGVAFAGNPPVCYDISTTAVVVPPIKVCIDYKVVTDPTIFGIYHFENGVWVNSTTSSTGGASGTVCGTVNSLSPFALFQKSTPADTTSPTTNISATPPANGAGWNNSDVSVTLTATDNAGGSGVEQISYSINGTKTVVAGNSAAFLISAEGTSTISYFATDNAGNSEAPHNLAIKLDKAPPLISDSRFPAANACGWNNVPVTVTFPCSDTLSGVAAGIPPMVFSAEGLDQSVNRTCFDVAGNSAGDTASGINIDFTPPVVNATVRPAANANGWNNSEITVNFTAADNLSGVASVTAPISITTEGKSQVVNGSATDFAGNTGLASTSANIDKTPPEAFNQFDPVTHDIVLFGRDSLSGVAPGPIQPFSIAPIFGSPTASVRAELRSYRVLDLAGNSLILTERVLHLTNIVATTVVSLQYGQASLVNLPFNIETYAWASNPDGSIQILAQFLQAGSGEEDPRFTGVFTSLKNMTAIEQEEPEPETIRQTAGLALLRMATQTGKLSIEY